MVGDQGSQSNDSHVNNVEESTKERELEFEKIQYDCIESDITLWLQAAKINGRDAFLRRHMVTNGKLGFPEK